MQLNSPVEDCQYPKGLWGPAPGRAGAACWAYVPRAGPGPSGLPLQGAACEQQQASQAASAPLDHEVMWQTLRQVQMRDEKRQRAFL